MNDDFPDATVVLILWAYLTLSLLLIVGVPLITLLRAPIVRRNAGDLLSDPLPIRLPNLSKRFVLFWCFWFLAGALYFSFFRRDPLFLLSIAGGPAICLGMPFLMRWCGLLALELRQDGIVIGGSTYLTWSEIKWFRWDDTPEFRLTVQFRHMRGEYPLRSEDRDEIDRILSERSPSGPPHAFMDRSG